MKPAIGRSIRQGFRSANRGVLGLALFSGGSLLLWLLMALLVGLTGIPPGLLRPPAVTGILNVQTAREDEGLEALLPEPLSLEEREAPGDVVTPVADPGEAVRLEAEERTQLAFMWFGRAWPMLLMAFLLFIAGNLWLQGGQIGYLAGIVQTQQATISTFWMVGTRAFRALCGASLLAFLAYSGGVTLIGVLLALMMGVMPSWLSVVLMVLLIVGTVGGFVWLNVRLALWFISMVLERLGPIAGLKATFHATQGQWWKVLGLMALLGLMAYGASLAFGLIGSLGRILGGVPGMAVEFVSSVLGLIANLYLGFVTMAALIQLYTDTQSCKITAPPAGITPEWSGDSPRPMS